MKTLIILLFPIFCFSQNPGNDSTAITQTIFESLGKYALVTNNGSSFDSVIHGTSEEIERLKPIEFQKALARRKAIAFVTVKCK